LGLTTLSAITLKIGERIDSPRIQARDKSSNIKGHWPDTHIAFCFIFSRPIRNLAS
jgi:hypothetical protein